MCFNFQTWSVNITYLPFSTHRQAANAAQALCGILDSPFINIWMPHERNITTWREQKGVDSPPPPENRSFVSSTRLKGRTSCCIFSPFFLLSDAMLIFHSQAHSTSSTGYTWHVALRIILHHLRKKSQAVNIPTPLQMCKGFSRVIWECIIPSYDLSASSGSLRGLDGLKEAGMV